MVKRIKIWHLFILSFLLVVPLVYSSSVADPALAPRLLALNSFLLVFLIYLLIRARKINWTNTRHALLNPIIISYILYLFVSGLSCFYATNSSEAYFEWLKQFGFFSFLILFCTLILPRKGPLLFFIKIIGVYSLLIISRGIYELFTLSALSEFNHQSSYFIRALSANRNLFSQTLFLVLPFNLYGLFQLKKIWKVVLAINTLLSFVLIILLLTRSVWLATVVSLFVATNLILFYSKSLHVKRNDIKTAIIAITTLILIIASSVFLYSRFGNPEVFKKQTYWISNYKFGSSLERVDLWIKTLKMAKAEPLTGVGLGNWRVIAPEYGVINLRDESGDTLFQRPHNDFLWVFAETGVFGFLLYVLIFVFGILSLLHVIRKNHNLNYKYLALLLISAIMGYLIIANLSFPKERIEHQVLLHSYLAIAIIWGQKHKKSSLQKNVKSPWFIVLTIFVFQLIGGVHAFYRFRSEVLIYQAYHARLQKDWNMVINRIDKASDKITTLDVYSTPLEWYKGESLFLLNKPKLALRAFQKAYHANPNHVHVLNNLATCYELIGQRQKAKKFYKRSLFVFPGFKESLLNLCALYYNENKFDSAHQMLQLAEDTVISDRHMAFLKSVLWKSTENLRREVDERQISKSLERIRNDENWMLKVHKQSCESGEKLDDELFREVFFLLESVDSTISAEQAQKFRHKYLNTKEE